MRVANAFFKKRYFINLKKIPTWFGWDLDFNLRY